MKESSIKNYSTVLFNKSNRLALILFIVVVCVGLLGCSDQSSVPPEENEETPIVMVVDGFYEGLATVKQANNSAQGETSDMKLRVEQRDKESMALINEEEEFEIIGTYNDETGEFHYESGGEVNFIFHLKFQVEGNTITAKGTSTTNQSGQGWTQSIDINLEKTADLD